MTTQLTMIHGAVKLWYVEGLDKLFCLGFSWLKDYFASHPEELEKLEVCKNSFQSNDTELSALNRHLSNSWKMP